MCVCYALHVHLVNWYRQKCRLHQSGENGPATARYQFQCIAARGCRQLCCRSSFIIVHACYEVCLCAHAHPIDVLARKITECTRVRACVCVSKRACACVHSYAGTSADQFFGAGRSARTNCPNVQHAGPRVQHTRIVRPFTHLRAGAFGRTDYTGGSRSRNTAARGFCGGGCCLARTERAIWTQCMRRAPASALRCVYSSGSIICTNSFRKLSAQKWSASQTSVHRLRPGHRLASIQHKHTRTHAPKHTHVLART